jgi:Asp-tRNA(Asn)/Glu-tRNA(Gln) amidotransferase A subunit family amidase
MGPMADAIGRLRAGDITAVEIADAFLDRIGQLEPGLRAWARVDADGAREQASSLTEPAAAGPLCGAPVGVKDNIDTAGLATTAGSSLLDGNVPGRDADAVRSLREAGAVVLGKTACTELATNDPAPTRNPWDPARTPGGSSAGSGAAVAARMCFATLDTQTAGDVLRPAAYNGNVGFKPTYGWISRRGSVPVAWSIDTLGMQTRTVPDAVLLYSALACPDQRTALPADRPPRIGVLRGYFYEQSSAEVRQHTDDVAGALAQAGAAVVEPATEVGFALLHAAHRTVTFAECAAVHEDLYQRHAGRMGEKLRTLIELGLVTPAVSYLQAQRVRAQLSDRLQRVLSGLDALLTPAAPAPAPADLTGTGSSVLQIPWTFGGFPAISIPTGLSNGKLPLAVQLVGAYFTEARLLSAAQWCSQVLDPRLPVPDPARGLG